MDKECLVSTSKETKLTDTKFSQKRELIRSWYHCFEGLD